MSDSNKKDKRRKHGDGGSGSKYRRPTTVLGDSFSAKGKLAAKHEGQRKKVFAISFRTLLYLFINLLISLFIYLFIYLID